jgi:hypothetical protein
VRAVAYDRPDNASNDKGDTTMAKSGPPLCTREFLELTAEEGVVDVVPLGKDTVYVFIRSGLSAAHAKAIRDIAQEWWNVPNVLISVRSTVARRTTAAPPRDGIKYR